MARSGPQRRKPVAQHEVVARDDAALERDALALAPNLGADGIAGKDRAREPRLDAFQPLRPAVGALPQNRTRRDAEACRPMQNGTIEAGGLGALRIGVERILVAVEPVQQREIGRRRQIADFLRRRLRHRMRHRRLGRLAAETAVLARKRAAVDGGDRRPVLADQVARSLDDGGVAGALVDDLLHARSAFGASGRCSTTLRSPATTRRSSMPKAGSVMRPGQPSTTAMVGKAASPARSYTNLSSPGSSGSMPTPMPSA